MQILIEFVINTILLQLVSQDTSFSTKNAFSGAHVHICVESGSQALFPSELSFKIKYIFETRNKLSKDTAVAFSYSASPWGLLNCAFLTKVRHENSFFFNRNYIGNNPRWRVSTVKHFGLCDETVPVWKASGILCVHYTMWCYQYIERYLEHTNRLFNTSNGHQKHTGDIYVLQQEMFPTPKECHH